MSQGKLLHLLRDLTFLGTKRAQKVAKAYSERIPVRLPARHQKQRRSRIESICGRKGVFPLSCPKDDSVFDLFCHGELAHTDFSTDVEHQSCVQ